MSEFALTIKNRQTYQALQQALKRFPADIDRDVQRVAIEAGRKMKDAAPKAFSTLTNSIKEERVAPMEWRVLPHVNYAEAVEKGTSGGGFVPFKAIFSWVKTKGIQPRKAGMDQADLAWAIQKKILASGSKSQPFVQPLVKSGWPEKRLNQLLELTARRTFKEVGL